MHQGLTREAPWCTDTDSRQGDRELARSPKGEAEGQTRRQHETEVDTEAGMLSGVSRKRSIRSNPCWFTEFCKSQCLSHFAAPFIVVQAETSVAESCKEAVFGCIKHRVARETPLQVEVQARSGLKQASNPDSTS